MAVVGAPGDQLETRLPGAAYVFTRENGVWTRVADLTASDGSDGDRFGVSVAVGGDTIVVSAKNHGVDSVDHGAVYVFSEPSSGWSNSTETSKLTASDGDEYHQFGKSVATDGTTVVVGAPKSFSEENPPGVAYVFERPSDGWADATETAQLTASDGHDFDFFGESVGVDGDTIVVGAPLNELDDHPSGSAYVFVRPDDGWATADETGKLTASDGELNNQFGFSVTVGGDYIVVSGVGDLRGRHRPGPTPPVAGVGGFFNVGHRPRHSGTPGRSVPPTCRFSRLRLLKCVKSSQEHVLWAFQSACHTACQHAMAQ